MGHAVETVDPGRAHGTWPRLPLAVHEVVDHQRAVRRGEELAQADGPDRPIPRVESRRALLERVILDGRALRKLAAQLRHPFALLHQLDLRPAELLAFRKILGRFVRQVRLSIGPLVRLMHHRVSPPSGHPSAALVRAAHPNVNPCASTTTTVPRSHELGVARRPG